MPIKIVREQLTAMAGDMQASEPLLEAATGHFVASKQATEQITDILYTVLPNLVRTAVSEHAQGAELLQKADQPFTEATGHLLESNITRAEGDAAQGCWSSAWRARHMLNDLLKLAEGQLAQTPESHVERANQLSSSLIDNLRALSLRFLDEDYGVATVQQTIRASHLSATTYLEQTENA